MAVLKVEEVRAGLSVFLDATLLGECPGVLTNARMRAAETRPADAFRPFLVLAVEADGACLCVPLFSKAGSDRVALDQALKSGPGKGWAERTSYFSRYQFWSIPRDCLVAASTRERNRAGGRQHYADGTPDALASIAAHRGDSDTAFHSPSAAA